MTRNDGNGANSGGSGWLSGSTERQAWVLLRVGAGLLWLYAGWRHFGHPAWASDLARDWPVLTELAPARLLFGEWLPAVELLLGASYVLGFGVRVSALMILIGAGLHGLAALLQHSSGFQTVDALWVLISLVLLRANAGQVFGLDAFGWFSQAPPLKVAQKIKVARDVSKKTPPATLKTPAKTGKKKGGVKSKPF